MSDYSIQTLCLDNLERHQRLPPGALALLRASVECARIVEVLDAAKCDGWQVTETLSRFGPEGEISRSTYAHGGGYACVRVSHPDEQGEPRYFRSETDEPIVAQADARAAAARWIEEQAEKVAAADRNSMNRGSWNEGG